MGRKVVSVSATLLTRMFTAGVQWGSAVCKVGLPEGARLVGVMDLSQDAEVDDPEGMRRVDFIFEHPDWPEEQGNTLPVVDVEWAEA